MRKILAFLLLAAMIAAMVAGCGQTVPDDGTKDTEQSTSAGDVETEGGESGEQNVPDPNQAYNSDPAKVVFGLESDTDDRTAHAFVAEESAFQRMTITQRECILFKHSRLDENQNYLRLSLDDETAKIFENGILNLVFDLYVTEKLTILVDYRDTSGEPCQKSMEVVGTRSWSYATVQMSDVAFTKGIDGYDLFITFKGPEIIRVSKVAFMLGDKIYSNKPTLIQSERITDELLVADCDVKYYGAVGDGVTDDTAAFVAAISQVSKTGGTVFVPEGQYVLTSALNLPNGVSLVGELAKGTTDGTVLLIQHGANSTKNVDCAISVGTQSAVKNICFYYPEQTMADGTAIPFPPTILQKATESITLANLYFVNAYLAIDCATDHENLSLQHIYDIYGCTLSQLYWNDSSYDIGRIENVFVGPEYWLNSGFPAPDAQFLKAYCRANSVGLHLQRIDWTYISDIHVSNYYMGILADQSQYGASNGHLYNLDFDNVYYGLCGKNFWWFLLTNCKIKVCSDAGATPVYIGKDNTGHVSCSYCEFSGGKNAVVNKGTGDITFGNCKLDGTDKALVSSGKYTLVNTTTGNDKTDYGNQTVQMNAVDFSAISYAPKYETKPASDNFIDLTEELSKLKSSRDDASGIIQNALDSLKGKGGTVYVPGGTYTLSSPLNVWAGIELRGASEAATSQASPTKFSTDYGRNDEEGTALFTLYEGAGLRGFRVTYPTVISEISAEAPVYTPYAYTVRGNGSRVYIINVSLHSSFNGVDFATYRCDEHYVQYIWGCPINVGIKVGCGSKGGIIRDVHYTPNCFGGNWNQVFSYIMSNSRCFWTIDCEDEVLYHNFTYAGWRGIEIGDGTENCTVICHGTDCGNYAAYVEGDCTATLIDSQLVNLPGGTPDFRAYIYTAPNFSGDVTFLNTGMWGQTVKTVYLEGSGHVTFYQGIISNSGSVTFNVVNGEAEIYGMVTSTGTLTADVKAYDGCDDCIAVGNLFASGGKFLGTMTAYGNKKA